MTHRCAIDRDAGGDAPADDVYRPVADYQAYLAGQPCRFWVETGEEYARPERGGVSYGYQMLLPADTDVREGDRVRDVTDRLGRMIAAGPFDIGAILPRPGAHLAVSLTESR